MRASRNHGWLSSALSALLVCLALSCGPVEEETNEAPRLLLRSPAMAPADAMVTFDATASTDDHGITLLRVQFGDGGAEEEFAGLVFTHVYSAPASYSIEVTVVDAEGEVDSLQRGLTVVEQYWPPYCDEQLGCEHGAVCDEGECFFEGRAGE